MIRLTTCLAIVAVLAAGCGGSDSGLSAPSGVATATIESIDGPFSAFTSGPFVLTGTGFGPVGTTVPVRFTSVIGAVFDGGSSEWATVDGTITSPTTITGMTPTAIPAGEFTTFVGVTLPGGKALLSFVPIARFVALEVAGAGTLSVPSDIPTDIEVEGDAFGTPGDMVTVKFVAATDAFRGGPSGPNATSVITAVGEVIDSTTVRVQTPVAGASLPTPARIGVVRADGFEGLSTTADLVFEPPSVTSATITSAQGSRPILWTLEGAGFVTPVGTATLLTMHYTAPAALPSGSPTATAMGMIIADGTIEAYTPLVAMLPAKVEVSVEIEFASGARVPLQSGGLTLEPTPVVMDDSFDVLTNVGLDVGSSAPSGDGLLANDSDPDPADTLSVVEFDAASTAGGQVVVRADGSFTYNPPPGFAGADAFTYTASDGVATAVGRVDLTVRHDVGTRTWFLHAEAAESSARDGRLLSPFRTVADFEAAKSGGGVGAPAAGDALFIFADTAVGYHAGLVLLDDMTLLGERAGLTLRNPPVSGAEVVIVPAGETTLLGDAQAPPMNVPAITLGANNTIRGLTVRNRRGAGLVGTAVGTLTVRDMSIAALGGSALDIDGGTLDVWLEDCSTDFTLTAAGAPDEYPAHGLRLLDVSGEVRIAPGNTTLPDADMTVVPTGTGQAAFRGTRLEAILVADTSGPLDVTSTGVTIREFASHGLVLDTVQGTFTVEETLQISEPRAPTSPMQSRVLVRITDSSADVLFDSVALTGGKVSAAAVTEVVANGIELIANTGTFQILGGGLGVCGDSAVLARDCTGAITLDGTKDRDDLGDLPDGLNIHSTGQRESAAASPPAHGVWVQNCTGAISIKQCTFNAIGERGDPITKAASILPADANDAVRVENDAGTAPSLIIEACRFLATTVEDPPAVGQPGEMGDTAVHVILDGSAVIETITIRNNEASGHDDSAVRILLDPAGDGTVGSLPRIDSLAIEGNGSGVRFEDQETLKLRVKMQTKRDANDIPMLDPNTGEELKEPVLDDMGNVVYEPDVDEDTGKKIYEHTAIEVDRLPLANGGDEIHIDVRGRARIASFSIADNTLAGDNDALPGAIFGQGSGIVLRSASTSAGDITLRGTIARNSLADVGNDAADVGIAITLAASSRAVLAVTDNTIDGQAGRAIAIALLDDASADLTVDGNDLGKVEGNDKVAAAMPMPPPLLGLTILCADDSILCVDLNTNDTAQGIDIREADAGRIDFGGFSFVGVYTDVIAEGELENLNTTPAMGVTVVAGDDASNCTPQSP